MTTTLTITINARTIERGANDWEKELRELTGLTSTSLDEVAHAAIEQNPPSS